MKKLVKLTAGALFAVSTLTSCYVNTFNVGKGAQSTVKVKKWNHYLIDGLIPVGQSDPKQMAGGTADYTVTIKHSFVNLVVQVATFSIYAPTTTIVTK